MDCARSSSYSTYANFRLAPIFNVVVFAERARKKGGLTGEMAHGQAHG